MRTLELLGDKTLFSFLQISESIRHFARSEKAVTAVEYAIVVAGVGAIVAVVFGDKGVVQNVMTELFNGVKGKLSANGVTVANGKP